MTHQFQSHVTSVEWWTALLARADSVLEPSIPPDFHRPASTALVVLVRPSQKHSICQSAWQPVVSQIKHYVMAMTQVIFQERSIWLSYILWTIVEDRVLGVCDPCNSDPDLRASGRDGAEVTDVSQCSQTVLSWNLYTLSHGVSTIAGTFARFPFLPEGPHPWWSHAYLRRN